MKDFFETNNETIKILDAFPGGIGVYEFCDGRLRLLYINEGYFRMIGASRSTRERFSGDNSLDAIHPEDRQFLSAALKKVAEGQNSVDIICRLLGGNDSYLWIRFVATVYRREGGRVLLYCSYSNVNELLTLQDELKRSHFLLDVAMVAAHVEAWELDLKNDVLLMRSSTNDYSETVRTVEDIPDALIAREFVHPDDEKQLSSIIARLKEGEKTVTAVIRGKKLGRRDWSWLRATFTNQYDEDGKPICAIGSTTDITDAVNVQRRYQEELDYRNSIGENLISSNRINLSNMMLEERRSAKHGAADESQKLLTNASFHKLCARSIPDAEECEEYYNSFKPTQLFHDFQAGITDKHLEYRAKLKNGETKWVKAHVKILKSPITGDVMAYVSHWDIDKEHTYQAVIDSIVSMDYDLIAVIDLNKDLITTYSNSQRDKSVRNIVNAPYEKTLSDYVSRFEGKGAHFDSLDLVSCKTVAEKLKTEELYSAQFRLPSLDDGKTHYKVMRFCWLDRDAGTVIASRADVTDIYEKEQKKKRELQKALDAAKQASAAKSDFLARMSHDIRTPMNAILGLTHLALDEISDEKSLDYFKQIHNSADYLLSLINDILDMSRIEQEKVTLNSVPVDAEQFINTVITIIKEQADSKHQKFITDLGTLKFPYQCFDKIRVQQVLVNILNNAVKYTPENGTITYRYRQIIDENGKPWCHHEVEDNGVGISPEFAKTMFEAFTQEQNSQSQKSGGTGLGLAICKNLVELMGGTIKVESKLGEGSTFIIDIPTHAMEKEAYSASVSDFSPQVKDRLIGKHVLMCEDHPLNATIAIKMLAKKGVTVVHAENGKAGLDTFAASAPEEFDAVLMDIRMPVMDGLEATRKIRDCAHPRAKTIPIIAMTANAFDEEAKNSRDAGMNDHLTKPFEPEKFFTTLAYWIEREKNENK